MRKKYFNQIINQVAQQYNVTPEEVRRDMAEAIDAGWNDPDPITHSHWVKMRADGKKPTVEDFLLYLTEETLGRKKTLDLIQDQGSFGHIPQ